MKKALPLLLCLIVLLSSCMPVSDRTNPEPAGPVEQEALLSELEELFAGGTESLLLTGDALGEMQGTAYTPPANATPQQLVEAYFEQIYKSYTSLTYIDISPMLDMSQTSNKNLLKYMQLLNQRRRLINQNNLAYVETGRFNYKITFLSESQYTGWKPDSKGNYLYFTITGAEGRAYPPLLAVNTHHLMRFAKSDSGQWKIVYHYFPGSVRKFGRNNDLSMPSDEQALSALKREFQTYSQPETPSIPEDARAVFNAGESAMYAQAYTENRNSNFYRISDAMGNCANFTSQAIWYGFGGGSGTADSKGRTNMTSSWYAGGGGGSPAWENVSHFWNFATQNSEMVCVQLDGISAMQTGDLLQTGTGSVSGTGRSAEFNHSLILVDSSKLVMAQNSPSCFVYYSDLVNVQTRFLRPVYLP